MVNLIVIVFVLIGWLEKVAQSRFQDTEDVCLPKAKVYSKKPWGMSLNFLVVADTLYSRVITTFLFAKVASAGMTAKHRCPIFPDSLWQPSHFITKMGIPYTLPKNYLLFIPMALTAFLGKEKVYTRQDMGIKKSSHKSYNRTKEKCLTTLRKSI